MKVTKRIVRNFFWNFWKMDVSLSLWLLQVQPHDKSWPAWIFQKNIKKKLFSLLKKSADCRDLCEECTYVCIAGN